MNINSATGYIDRRSVIALGFIGGQPTAPSISAEPPEWTHEAMCASIGPDLFFSDHHGDQLFQAKQICRRCPVIAECLEWALSVEEHEPDSFGVFGGLGGRQRRRLLRRRRQLGGAA